MGARFRIALLGAESTGKTDLSVALAGRLHTHGLSVAVVPEVLREWCVRESRTPRADEQLAIAREQARRVDEAGSVDVVIADTTPLMTAIYSDMLFGDRSIYPFALQHQGGYQATLVTGLDLPWRADGLQRDGPHVREPVDALLRGALAGAAIAYKTVYGLGPERLCSALRCVGAPLHLPASPGEAAAPRSREWQWACERCSDPDCEHRLFTGRMRSKAAGHPAR